MLVNFQQPLCTHTVVGSVCYWD